MNPETWEQAKDVITEALKRVPSERERFVRERCGDAALANEIITLLDAYRDGTNFLADPPEQDDDDIKPGTKVGPYVIIDSIGRGGMGQVFLGSDPRLRRKVALKCVIRSIAGSGERRLRILHEARAAASVMHPNVATIHDVVEHENRAFIVMEYVDGESLAARLKRQRTAVGRQLASALSAAHAKRVVHRDLKPGNVHFTTDGTVKILDFGIANAPRMATTMAARHTVRPTSLQPTGRGMQPGTPPYMSPEQLMGREVDERSDIYSLGVVLFEMATGRRPYRELEAAELVAVLADGPQRADAVDPRVPRGLADVIDKALARDLDERYQSAADLSRALDDLDRSLHSPVPAVNELFQKWFARVAVGVAAVPFVFAVLGLISTGTLNVTLGRRGFDVEPFSATLVWGARSVIGPAILIVILLTITWLVASVLQVARTVKPIDRLVRRVTESPACAHVSQLALDPIRVAQLVAMGGGIAIGVICWRFRDMLEAWSNFADTMPASDLVALGDVGRQLAFRFEASLLVVVLGFLLVHVLRMRSRQNTTRGRSTVVACCAVLAAAVLLNDAPYRLIYDTTGQPATLSGHRCYVIGESVSRVLLFCPDLPPPRNRIVAQNDPALLRLGIRESIFTAR